MRNFLLAKRPQRRRAKEKRMLSANGQEVAEKGEREREKKKKKKKKKHKQLKF